MNDNTTAHTANMVTAIARVLPLASLDEVTELIVSGMRMAYAEGKLDGIRDCAACIEAEQAILKMRSPA